MIRGLPAAGVGGKNHGLGPDVHGFAALGMEAHRAGDAAAVGDDVGDDRAAETAHAESFAFLLEQAGLVHAAHAVGMIVIVAHVVERALRNEAQFAVGVARELVSEIFEVEEAVVGLREDVSEKFLIGQTVIIVDQILQQIVELHVGLLDDHVAAGEAAETAPVARTLVDHEHVAQKFLGPLGRPHAAEAAPDNKKIGGIAESLYSFHEMSPVISSRFH